VNLNSPLFVLTSDVDWAPDHCIEDLAEAASARDIRPVFFATGPSQFLDRAGELGQIEIGIHPNFRSGSTQGGNEAEVISLLCDAFPAARCWRSHSFVDSTPIVQAMRERGMLYDSNLNLHLQDDIQPLTVSSGAIRFPVFWEDDLHWVRGDSWDADDFLGRFLTAGLKILNVHPASFALNIPNDEYYRKIRADIPRLSADEVKRRCFDGPGTRTFVLGLLDRLLKLGHRFHTLEEVYTMSKDASGASELTSGRVSEAEFQQYWQMTASERQIKLRELFNKRSPTHPYATSRDGNLRELEITAIARCVPSGKVLDLGCGNGYTLISIASRRADCQMIGVDFAERLIEGARQLASTAALQSHVDFIAADAIEYVREVPDETVDGVITERFLLNLPDEGSQRAMIAEIFRVVRPGGRFVMCEGSMKGFRALNDLREQVGLPKIEERSSDNASANRFEDREIEAFCAGLGFTQVEKLGFRDYFIVSRVLHPLLVMPQPVTFDARINDLARQVQSAMPFTPDLGSNVVWVFAKRTADG